MAPSPAGAASCSESAGSSREAPTLKSKKSLDWISKSFKRKSSTVSVALSSSEGSSSSASATAGGGGHQGFSSKRDRELHGSAANRIKNGGEPLLAIPGSPAVPQDGSSWSRPPSSHGEGSDNDSRSQASSSTNSPRYASYAQNQYIQPPLPSPSTLPISTTPVIPVTLRETRPTKADDTPKKAHLQSQPPLAPLPAPGPLNGTTSRAAKRSSSDYEQLLVHLSSRKALRTMLDECVNRVSTERC